MGAPFPSGVLQQAVDALAESGGNKALAYRTLGWAHSTFKSRLAAAKAAGLVARKVPASTASDAVLAMIETLRVECDRLKAENESLRATAHKPHFTLRQDLYSSASKIRVCAVGDLHDGPKIPDKSRFYWIGRYVNETKPDVLNLIGDAFTMDSLNSHIPNENYNGRCKPTFLEDMASGEKAFQALDAGLDNFKPEEHEEDGNHERRLYLFEDRAPEAHGMMQFEYDALLERHGITHSPYGAIQYYGGVGFVHAALNTLGKTYGGKNSLPTIANDSISDLVIGHSHRARVHSAPKIGQRYPTTILDLGCALPNGHVEDYAEHALNGWTYGIYDLVIQHGHIQSAKFVSMAELEERYGS